ncbi:MAG: extensin family protein [Deltaproteobacteria bacterium]|nr:extensin family protein [Deltaproteobacteria bacterium]
MNRMLTHARRILLLAACFLLAPAGSAVEARVGSVVHYSFFDGWPSEHYALDGTQRFLPQGQRLRCDSSGLVRYRSEHLRYTVRVNPAFAQRLAAFDRLLEARGREAYGRAPRRLVQRGAYNCRSARGRRGRISEHAFGNALDFQGLDFPRLPRGAAAPAGMPRRLRRGFSLRIADHWGPRRTRDAYHARFLHALAEQLRGHTEIFRGIVGPPQRRHRNHLHLDAAPWHYAMFAYEVE